MQFLILIIVNLLLFGKTITYGAANDDFEILRCSCKEPQPREIKSVVQQSTKLVCAKCTLRIRDKPKNRYQDLWWHLIGHQYTNLKLAHTLVMIIHNANTALIYLAFGQSHAAFLAALLFAVHPVATQGSSVWLSGKPYGMSLTLVLLMFWLKPLAPIFYWLALFFGVPALTAPLAFIHSPWWPMMLIIPAIVYLRRKRIISSAEVKYKGIKQMREPIRWHNAILAVKTIGYYFILCLWPTTLGAHHTYLELYGMTDAETKDCLKLDRFFTLGAVLISVVVMSFFWNYNQAVFGLLWFFIFIAPWSNIVTCHMFISERYAVIALAGFCWMASNLMLAIPIPAIRIICITAFFVRYATRTEFFIPAYKNVLDTAQYDVLNFPRSFAGWCWKGAIENNLQLHERAFESWINAWGLRPHDFRINNNLATFLASKGEFAEAKRFYNMALKCPVPKSKEEHTQRQLAILKSEIISKEAILKRGITQVPRNQPCPCGEKDPKTGRVRKYKHCCGKELVWART